ncbi:uncharacterized protein F5147DRAFT_651168 [Suillus discolor]|uniref:Uncharacterized protein n=1 Tax=Suillus discolor TaxID=1912936 RepID=A0A9P7FB69_9AGAM|nr:uncharacterized protein F5147DRAFT_651168 [Suillus discolor]KAG2112070.1 hypothetical protein F5147DRAFT_651168 [Suillus discolor]
MFFGCSVEENEKMPAILLNQESQLLSTGKNVNAKIIMQWTILLMREDITRKSSTYSHLEEVEAIGCIFDMTQDEAARQASNFVMDSNLIVKLGHDHNEFIEGVGAYEILLSKLNEAPVTITGGCGQLWYWRKLQSLGIDPKKSSGRSFLTMLSSISL